MMGKGHKFTSIDASPESPTYREQMQKKGFPPIESAQKPTPMKANPVTKQDPGLGAATIPHPFKTGKPTI